MKHLITLSLTIFIIATANADQRMETWQGLCHYNYDVNDDDNEVYYANCENTIDTYDNGNGRLAKSSSEKNKTYTLKDATFPVIKDFNHIGNATDPEKYPGYVVNNAPCISVTSNYNAAADDNNETVYVTNDWNLEITVSQYDYVNDTLTYTYKLNCRDGVSQ